MANEDTYNVSGHNNHAVQIEGLTEILGNCEVGLDNISGTDYPENGALRFTNIAVPQGTSVNVAELHIIVEYTSGSGTVRARTYAIYEDNVPDFSTAPWSKTLTTSYTDNSWNDPADGSHLTIDITNAANQVFGRGGWSSGNAIAFMLKNNGSDSDNFIGESDNPDGMSWLSIRLTATPDFTPGPYTVRFPNKPPKELYGMKVSQEKHEVGVDEVEMMYFTSGKVAMKVHKQALQSTSASGSIIRHGLPYVAPALVFSKSGANRYLLNRMSGGALTSGKGFVACNNGYLSVYAGSDVYYYIFIDPLKE